MRREWTNIPPSFVPALDPVSAPRLPWVLLFSAAALFIFSGCARPAGVIFPAPAKAVVWPAPPEQPRIRYVGQLSTSADLKPAIPFGQALGHALFGKTPSRSMLTPFATCTDGRDRLFVADSNAQVVQVFNMNSRQFQQWKPPAGSPPFAQPVGITWDEPDQTLYVADSAAGRIIAFDTNGKMTGVLGSGIVNRPCGLAFDAASRRIIVADSGLHQVLAISTSGQLLQRAGPRGVGLGQFNYPTNVAIDSKGRIYVSDSLNFRVQQLDSNLRPLRQIGRKGDMPGYFGQPKGLALDSQDHLYVVDSHFEAVQVFDAEGNLLMDFGQEGNGPGEFWLPAGIFIDVRNRIWIADSYNRRVQVFDFLPEGAP